MRVVNKLTSPGGIRRVDLNLDTVRIETATGQDRLYRLATVTGDGHGENHRPERTREITQPSPRTQYPPYR